jgi:hypothetical protein
MIRPEMRDTRSVSEIFEPGLRKPVESPDGATDILCVSIRQSTRLQTLARVCLAVFCLVSFGGSLCRAQGTYTAASCNQSDVNAVINGPTHKAVNGDTIIVPTTGSPCTWTSGIAISGVGIDITGTGTPNTGAGTVGAGTPSTTLISNIPHSSNGGAFFWFQNLTRGETAKVELLTLNGTGDATYAASGTIMFSGSCTTTPPYCASIRVDNINWSAGTWGGPISDGADVTINNVFGVIDHNSASETINPPAPLLQASHSSWQGVGDYGDNSFASADTFGSAQAIYIENNSVNGMQIIQNDVSPEGTNTGGVRYTCRFNTLTSFNGTGICSSHGTGWGGRFRGMRQMEVYYNTASTGSQGCDAVDGILSGTGFYLSNHMNAVAPGATGCNFFLSVDIARFIQNSAPWGSCNGTEPWDQYPNNSTSACLDQPGAGPGAAGSLFSTQTPPTLASNPKTACAVPGNMCWPSPALDPIYEAGETITGGFQQPIQIATDGTSTRILANRDVYGEVSQLAQSSPSSPFNGTVGTGYGTLANRPTTCTPGVGYWATDQGTWNTYNSNQGGVLYICAAANAWSVGYTPYTYPHPLTAGGSMSSTGPNPPTSLTATVQ